ncbi:hypothetical protein [Ammoniphilus resinae]|uniref:Uncharacterized protein n=1 Tax=Ammoniphilus resinae TaxID=861532 RepID=A0ABS4GN94_9BACL|nr:hypothetical protein [Ammoniphilus resinae]MBP1931757.1 hypothetical protein [Ammoniphilus resinae]
MSKSLFVPHQTLSEYQMTMDNMVMAKLLHDNQIPVPDIPFACNYREDSFFYQAMSLLFQTVLCHEEEHDYGQTVVFSLRSSLIEEWMDLAHTFPDEEWKQRLESVFDPVQEYLDDYFELCTRTEITSFGLRITISGSFGFFHPILESFIECKQCLEQELEEMKAQKGEDKDDRNIDHDARGNGIRPYRTAV